MQVEGVVFVKDDEIGDYEWMVEQPKYDDAIFVIMENVLHSLSPNAADGGGTAALRTKTWLHMTAEERIAGPPRAVGIPTGFSVRCGGFTTLDCHCIKAYIDLSFERLLLLLHTYPQIKRVVYSADADKPDKIGSGIFKPHQAVVDYISRMLMSLKIHVPDPKMTFEMIRKQELLLIHTPLMLDYIKYQQQVMARSRREMPSDNRIAKSVSIAKWLKR